MLAVPIKYFSNICLILIRLLFFKILTLMQNKIFHTANISSNSKVLQIYSCPNSFTVCSPVLDQGDIDGTSCSARSEVEGSRRPQESNAIGCVVCVEWGFFEEGFHKLSKLKLLIIIWQRLLTLRGDAKNNESLLRAEGLEFNRL